MPANPRASCVSSAGQSGGVFILCARIQLRPQSILGETSGIGRGTRRRLMKDDPPLPSLAKLDEKLRAAEATRRKTKTRSAIQGQGLGFALRLEEHTSALQSLMRISYAVF